MKKIFVILICSILLASNSFGCTKVYNTQEHIDIISYDKEILYKQAESLTKHILSNALKITHINSSDKITFSSRDIFDFVITLFIYKEDPDHPYNNISEIRIENNGMFAHYKFEDVQRAVKELFGVENWFDPILRDSYDKNLNEMFFSIEKGMPGQYFTYENIQITPLSDTNYIEVEFELLHFNPYEEEKGTANLGLYKIVFEVKSENGKDFLRIHRFEPVKSKELKKFTIPFKFMGKVKLTESDTYKADITLPSHWMRENPIVDDDGIVFQGFTSLYNIDDNYKFTDSSWKDFRRIDWDFDSMIPSTGMTANGYEYVTYKAPNNETYFCYIKVIPGYASDFSIHLDGIYDTTINEILDSICFYK